jgi:hypothetical protein
MNWQPIETAPKDGTRVLIYGYWDGELSDLDEEPEVWKARFSLGTWWVDSDQYYVARVVNPTHWMPLPKPPKRKQNK